MGISRNIKPVRKDIARYVHLATPIIPSVPIFSLICNIENVFLIYQNLDSIKK